MAMALDLDLDWSKFITNTSTVDEVKERKDIKSIVNETVESIRKLINEYGTISFQEELFKLIKYNDTC